MTQEVELAELKQQLIELQQRMAILTELDGWLPLIKTQPLSPVKYEIYLPLGDEPITGQTYMP